MTSYVIPGPQRWLSERDWKQSAITSTLSEADTLSGRLLLSWTSRSTQKVTLTSDEIMWLDSYLRDAQRLLALPEGWDSYGSEMVTTTAVTKGLILLLYIMPSEARPPQVVPTVDGGVQLEWHDGERELEIQVPSEGKGEITWQESRLTKPWETTFSPELPSTDVLQRLRKAIAEFVTV